VFEPLPVVPDSDHSPNHFSVRERVANLVLALFLLAYGSLSLYRDDMHLRGRYTSGIHLHGTAAWLMFGAMLAAVAVLLAIVIDHYDRRNNEHHYVWFKRGAVVVCWMFFGAALLWDLWEKFSK
jgi:hypothetical protein